MDAQNASTEAARLPQARMSPILELGFAEQRLLGRELWMELCAVRGKHAAAYMQRVRGEFPAKRTLQEEVSPMLPFGAGVLAGVTLAVIAFAAVFS